MKLDINVSKQDEDFVIISIIDNGIGRKKSNEIKNKKLHKKKSIGLKLTEERLSNFSKGFKNSYELLFTDLTDGEKAKGTKVTIKLPLR
jgi:sensor histidine kinase YesM